MKPETKKLLAFLLISCSLLIVFLFFKKSIYGPQEEEKTSVETGVHTVDLLGDHASPNEFAIKVGEYIQFNTKDNSTHNIAEGQGAEEGTSTVEKGHDHGVDFGESGSFGAGEAYKVKISKVGAYFFHDHVHPAITVTVLVYDPKK